MQDAPTRPASAHALAHRFSHAWVLIGVVSLLAILLGVAFLTRAEHSDVSVAFEDASGAESTPESPSATGTLSPQGRCENDTIIILSAHLQDLAAGYENGGGPGSALIASEYGVVSDEAIFAAKFFYIVAGVYFENGIEAATDSVVSTAMEACADQYGSSPAPATSDTQDANAGGQSSATSPSSGSACTLGVSACQFDNGIDFVALRAEVARDFSVATDDVSCDLAPMPPNTAPVGETFYCATDETMYPTVQVTVLKDAPFYAVAPAPPSGD